MRRRGQKGSAVLDRNALRRAVQDNTPMSTSLGVVRKFPGEDSHFEIITDENGNREVMVDVELIPMSEKVFCRLGFGGDQIYRIPRVNQEVAVLIPGSKNSLVQDELELDPIIIAVLDIQVPTELDSDDIVVINSDRVKVIATSVEITADTVLVASGDIQLGDGVANPLDQVVVGSGIDMFSGQTYYALQSTTSKVKAVK